jgi:predicted MFS family arabinose efflux permease
VKRVTLRGGDRVGAGYTRFIAAVATSFYGDWFTTVALLVAVYELSPGPVAPAVLTLVRLAPRLVASPVGGRLADRINPGVLAASTSLVQAVAAIGLVGAVTARSLPLIDVLVAVSSLLGAIARPAHMPIITALVPADRRPRANALYGSTFSLSLAVAPALAAAAVAVTGPRLLLVLDAASFVVAAWLLLSLPLRRAERATTQPPPAVRGSTAREVLGNPFLRIVAAGGFAGGLCAAAAQAVLVVGAADRFGGESHVGFLYAAVGAGAAAGTLLSVRMQPARITRAIIGVWVLLEVAGLALVGIAPSLVLAGAALTVNGAAAGLYQTWAQTEVQRRVAADRLGRVSGFNLSALYLGWLLGAGLGIVLGGRLRWDDILLIACGVAAAALVAAWTGRRAGVPQAARKTPEPGVFVAAGPARSSRSRPAPWRCRAISSMTGRSRERKTSTTSGSNCVPR